MADAQRRTTILIGTGDAGSGLFLPSVQVEIASLKLTQYTDSLGEARFIGVPPGKYTIEARRVGFQPLSAPVLIAGQDSLEVVLLMRASVAQLDTVVVSKARIPMALREFESHRERGFGQFVTGAQIDSMPGASLQAIVDTHLRGATVLTDAAGGTHVATYRPPTGGGLCHPLVYLNGVMLADDDNRLGPDLGIIAVGSIGGIEFYEPSEIPVQYRAPGPMPNRRLSGGSATTTPSCGAVLIWTKP